MKMNNINMNIFTELQGIKEINEGVSTGNRWIKGSAGKLESFSPVDGKLIGSVNMGGKDNYEEIVAIAQKAFIEWRAWPAPRRGEIVRQAGEALRKHKNALGRLVSCEKGKSLQEGYGEIQEMIYICDFAVGLSR